MKILLSLALLLFALPTLAGDRTRVPAAELVATATDWLEAKASEEGIPANFVLVGRINDVQLVDAAPALIKVGNLKSGWLRPRIGIPVQVVVADKAIATVTVWFSVSAPHAGLVYAKKQNKAVVTDQIEVQTGKIDLAKTKGRTITSLDGLTGMRLRHAVAAGQALQVEDFEPVPTVKAQQIVRVEIRQGAVRLSVAGRALADAGIGEMVQVLPNNAAQAVRARVVSQQVVVIEN